ncbi:hypothetical protein [Lactobacillus taiwanensis]|uniref:hypothetical protein n=1 Tax=Lactobacillus taiwanensis TaxID=508451 RepID=UPI00321F8D0C
MNNCFFLVILITLTFLVAFFTMFRSFWTIYHQTTHTVRHLGRKHNVKCFLAVSTLASIWFSLLASLVTLYSATHFWLKHSKTVISITPLTVLAALNTNELT